MNPKHNDLLLKALSRPELKDDTRSCIVDYLSGVRGEAMWMAARTVFMRAYGGSLEDAVAGLLFNISSIPNSPIRIRHWEELLQYLLSQRHES